MLSAYKAQSGTLAYNAPNSSCSGVACHGGQTTPNWESGTIDVNTDCTVCHEVEVNQYNSPSSGKHKKHVTDKGFDCTACHNANDLLSDPVEGSIELLSDNHFVGLDTSQLEGDPAKTIRNYMNYNTSVPQPTCTFGALSRCHDTDKHKNPIKW